MMAITAFASPFVTQGARDAFAAGLAHVEEQVPSIKQGVVDNPALVFDLARTLVETACRAILNGRKVEFSPGKVLFPMEPESYRIHLAEFDRDTERASASTDTSPEAAP